MSKQRYIVCIQNREQEHPQVPEFSQVEVTGSSEYVAILNAIMEHQPKRVVWIEEAVKAHGHCYTSSRDCDGPHEYWSTFDLPEDHKDGLEGALEEFVKRWVPMHDDFTFERNRDGQGNLHMTISRQTDEGYHSESYWLCGDGLCEDVDKTETRDVFAESMGY
jgi:hypothetical protein